MVSVKEIGLRWATSIAAGPNYAYLSDHLNLRTVRVKLGYVAEAETKLQAKQRARAWPRLTRIVTPAGPVLWSTAS